MLNVLVIIVALTVGAYLAFSRRLASSSGWQATVTPLASIMGSGFLVSAPLLAGIVGNLAVFFMASLLLLAYMIGSVMRFNIRHFEPIETAELGPTQSVAFVSRLVLSGAYFISISYYLKLLAAFLLNTAGIDSLLLSNIITSGLLIIICGVGIWRGLSELGLVEKYAVALNLGMIVALLSALGVFNAQLFFEGRWELPNISSTIDWHDARILLGLLIVVQGFEASRYLGDAFSAEQRIATMRQAQLIASIIYLIFIALATVLFHDGLGADVTAIIGMTEPVALVLPLLLTIAAIGSQFSAAVADTEGAGGLIEDITARKIQIRYAYVFILAVTLALTWETDVNAIIAYASRAFALYYALQACVAFLVVLKNREMERRRGRLIIFAALALIAFMVFAFGIPAE